MEKIQLKALVVDGSTKIVDQHGRELDGLMSLDYSVDVEDINRITITVQEFNNGKICVRGRG